MAKRSYPKSAAYAALMLATASACAAFAHDPAQHDHSSASAGGVEAAYLAENDAAMDKMMAGMEAKPSGDVDRDFVAMMIPHHQGAIEMARLELRYGRDPRLRRLAQGIVVEQSQEIALMRDILANPSTAPGTDLNP